MITYNKSAHKKSTVRKTYRFMKVGGQSTDDGENFLGFSRPAFALNVKTEDGIITNVKGFKGFAPEMLSTSVPPAFEKYARRIFKCSAHSTTFLSGNHLIVTDNYRNVFVTRPGSTNEFTKIGSTDSEVLGAVDFVQKGEDIAVLSTFSGLYMYNIEKSTLEKIAGAPATTSMCTHRGRLFAVQRTAMARLWFSDAMDVTNWNVSLTEGGYIDLDAEAGAIQALKSMGEYLYIFCENSIWKLTAYGDQREFAVSKVLETSGTLCYASVVMANGAFYYKTDNGFFRFDGYNNAVRIMEELDGIMDSLGDVTSSTYHGTEIIFAVHVKTGKWLKYADGRAALLRYDLFTGEITLFQYCYVTSVLSFKCSEGTLLLATLESKDGNDASHYVAIETDEGSCFGVSLNKVYRTGYTDLGMPDKKKLVRRLTFCTDSDIVVKLITDVGEYEYPVKAGIARSVTPKVACRKFALSIETDSPTVKIVNPTVTVDFYE